MIHSASWATAAPDAVVPICCFIACWVCVWHKLTNLSNCCGGQVGTFFKSLLVPLLLLRFFYPSVVLSSPLVLICLPPCCHSVALPLTLVLSLCPPLSLVPTHTSWHSAKWRYSKDDCTPCVCLYISWLWLYWEALWVVLQRDEFH